MISSNESRLAARTALKYVMQALSEEIWAVGWADALDTTLAEHAAQPDDQRDWVVAVRWLSEQAGGWWRWDEQAGDLVFVPALSNGHGRPAPLVEVAEPAPVEPAWQAQMATLADLDDGSLWNLQGASPLSMADQLVLASLSERRYRVGLTDNEEAGMADLLRRVERASLLKAEAVALLQRRGQGLGRLLPAV